MQALGGAMRIAPADPGGDQASNQGLSVNAIAAVGTSAPAADAVTLAPRPVELQDSDTAGLIMASGPALPAEAQVQTAQLTVSGQASAGIPILASDTVVNADPEDPPLALTNVTATSGDIEADPAVPKMRPHARPPELTVETKTPVNVQTVSAGPAVEIDPATVTPGTRMAQLGAFDTPALAREKFAELQGQFAELMTGKAMVIQGATSGGRTFYRLRAHGFEGDDDARRFCAALQGDGADCIPVAQR